MSPRGHARWLNPSDAFAETLGWDRDTLRAKIEKGWKSLVHPDDAPMLHRLWERTIEAGRREIHAHLRVRDAGGADRWMAVTGWFTRTPDGAEDWTVEASPLPSDDFSPAFLLDLVDAFDHPVFLLDGERRILAANRAARSEAQRVFGEPLWIGQSMDELSNPDDMASFHEHHARAMGGEPVSVQRALQHPSGPVVHYRFRYQPARSAGGDVFGVVLTAEDRTEEEVTAKRRHLYEAALDQSTAGVTIADAGAEDFPLIYINEGFERLTGYPRERLLGRNCRLLQGPETDRSTVAELRAALEAGRSHRAELLNYRRDGSTFWNELSLLPIRNADGELTHYLGLQVDVTERRRVRQRLEAADRLETLGLLAGGMAHDFNNVLAAIGVNAELLYVDPGDERAMQTLAETVERGREMTRSLLAFARAQPSAPVVFDLRARLEMLHRMLRRLVGGRHRLRLDVPDEALTVRVDPAQLDQVVMNLVLNARDAHARSIAVSAERAAPSPPRWPTGSVVVRVRDDGEGMTNEVMARAFEPLFTTRAEGEGGGLGLAIAHGIVHRHGGEIELESAPGRGTTASVRLAFAADPPTATKVGAHEPRAPIHGARLLVVEDERPLREAVAHLLEKEGYEVLRAGSLEEAMTRIARDAPIDLVVLDVMLPDGRGPSLVERIRAPHPGARILLTTGYAPLEVVPEGSEVLLKPFRSDELLDRVRALLARPAEDGTR
ncbi:MAG TPA: PAS domain S-box protein [Sandaracinaceae bacterium LLY-WYZ-13_1]|nr:PAS domain S-box protein [Sandaracinaceae bacterium LLY-WYZ-13_1]